MQYLIGLVLLASFNLVGSLISNVLSLPLPGSMIGMLLLFVCLSKGLVKARHVKDACIALIGVMPLFLVPASMGVMNYLDLLIEQWLPLLGSTIASTLIVLVVMALILDRKAK